MTKMKDDIIEHKESDIEKIQTSPNMYISYVGPKGSLHLAKEATQNAVDECINENSPANTIDVFFDERDGSFMVKDNGRGIQFDKLEITCTKLQSSGKFGRKGSGGASSGQNGVGNTAINAMSDLFEVISYRGPQSGEKLTLRFEKGKKVEELIEPCDNKIHGLSLKFIPSKKYLGKKCNINREELIEWFDKMSYLLPNGIVMNLNMYPIGKTASIHTKYTNKNGLYDYMKKSTKLLFDPIHIKDHSNVQEFDTVDDKMIDRFMGIEVAYGFTTDEPFKDSFCNFINTVDGGTHIKAVEEAISQFIFREVKASLSEKDKKNLEIKYYDITSTLSLCVYIYTDMTPQFSGQTKEKLTNEEFAQPIKDMIFRNLRTYYKNNPKDLKRVCDLIRTIAKARFESQKIRNSVIKGKEDLLSEHKIKCFRPATNIRGKEIYLVEGDSARGCAVNARNSRTQAIFAFKGVPLNAYKNDLPTTLQNEEFKALVSVLGCNIGVKFDIKKLKYDKIIIMTDADIDGNNITSLLCAFFIKFMPELVEAGLIYKSIPPLYRLKDSTFITNRKQYLEKIEERTSKLVKVVDAKKGEILTRNELKELLIKNRTYLSTLENVASNLTINMMFLEFLIMHMNDKNFDRLLKKRYPEVSIQDNGTFITGVAENQLQSLVIDKMFYKRIKELKRLMFEVNESVLYYRVIDIDKKNGDCDRGIMSLGGLLTYIYKFKPVIDRRYKGLGEVDADELWETTMNPENRTLIRLTIQDMQRELEIFNMLHGTDDGNKQMMRDFKIDREDLDN